MSRLQVSLLEGEAFGSSIDGTFMASLDEPPVGRPVGRVHRHWRTLLGVLYLLGMGMCSVVLCALGATLQELAANCGRSSLAMSSVYVARGAGSILGAMACAATFKRLHGNHVIAGTLAALSSVLLVLPYTTDATALHVLFALLGSMTATIDTGVQIMTRKAHGARAVRHPPHWPSLAYTCTTNQRGITRIDFVRFVCASF
jgi:predicted MFS family arabinose efflux permease